MTGDTPLTNDQMAAMRGRILARPLPLGETPASADPEDSSQAPGLYALGLTTGEESEESRDGLLYIPAGYDATRPAALVVLLHGASYDARSGLAPLLPLADAAGLLLLAPDARLQKNWPKSPWLRPGDAWPLTHPLAGVYTLVEPYEERNRARGSKAPAHLTVGWLMQVPHRDTIRTAGHAGTGWLRPVNAWGQQRLWQCGVSYTGKRTG